MIEMNTLTKKFTFVVHLCVNFNPETSKKGINTSEITLKGAGYTTSWSTQRLASFFGFVLKVDWLIKNF